MIVIYPELIAPLFNKFEPLKDKELKEDIETLAKKLKFPLKEIKQMDGSKRSGHSNAYFYGLWKFKKIVVYDTILTQDRKEILAVVSHELGHWKHKDFYVRVSFSFVNIFAMFFVFKMFKDDKNMYNSFGFHGVNAFVIGITLFSNVFTLVGILINVLNVLMTRYQEYQADRNQLKVESPSVEQSIKIINSCGRLHYSDSELIETLVGIVKANIETITTKNLVSILHSLTKLRFPDVELLSSLSLVAAKGLEEISDVALANLTIATKLLENGRKLMSQLLPEIKSRSSTSSPLDNLRHVIALSNMKHLITSELDLKECLDKLLRFINCSVLYYEHLILLFECVKTLNYTNEDFVFDNLVPSLLNKRTEHNATAEFDLRLLKCLSGTGNLSRSSEFLLDQVLENLSKKIWRHPKLIKHAFNLVNTTEADPTPFLKGLQEYLERSNKQLDSGATAEIKSSMQRSKEEWNKLELLIESSM
nr:hypothetical protein MACL_00000002 [Theileria orientalis]